MLSFSLIIDYLISIHFNLLKHCTLYLFYKQTYCLLNIYKTIVQNEFKIGSPQWFTRRFKYDYSYNIGKQVDTETTTMEGNVYWICRVRPLKFILTDNERDSTSPNKILAKKMILIEHLPLLLLLRLNYLPTVCAKSSESIDRCSLNINSNSTRFCIGYHYVTSNVVRLLQRWWCII